MAKLPDNFVKAPADTSRVTTTKPAGKPADKPVGKEVRRKARRDAPPPAEATEPGAHSAHSALVRLSPEEHQALSAACEALAAAGEIVTIEDMIRQVVARWIAATRAAAATEPGEPAAPAPAAPHAIDDPGSAALARRAAGPSVASAPPGAAAMDALTGGLTRRPLYPLSMHRRGML
jgi:hypothetical protein